MKEEDSKRNKLISLQFKEKIKKKPYSEVIEGTTYTYSLLKKKNQVFILTNERLLVLIGYRSIAYARNLPQSTSLPFYRTEHLPPFKYNLVLSAISKVTAQDSNLLIQFQPQVKMPLWEFECDSRSVAEEWRGAILEAIRVFEMEAANVPIAVNLRSPGVSQDRVVNQAPFIQEPKQVNGFNQNVQPQAQPFPLSLNVPIGNPPVNEFKNHKDLSPELIIPATLGVVNKGQAMSNVVREYNPNLQVIQQKQVKSEISQVINYAAEYQSRKLAESRERELLEAKQREMPEQKQFSPVGVWSQKSSSRVELTESCHWDYEFAKGQSQYIVIQRFKQYVEPIAVKIIEEQALKPGMREYRPFETTSEGMKYSVEGVELLLSLLELAEVSSFTASSTIISGKAAKRVRTKFKNTNYILQCTKNRGSFRVPLMMIVSYKGYQVLAKASVHSSPEYSSQVSSLQQEMSQLERETRVSRELFQEEQNIKVLAADTRWFQKMARSQNKSKTFDYCFLTDVQHFLPQDLHWSIKEDHLQLRGEMLQDEALEGLLLPGGNLSSLLGRNRMPIQAKQAINTLTELSASIPARATALVQDLENLDCSFTNSKQLSDLLHESGLNIRYLGTLLDLAKSEWLSSILHSEIIARAAKYFLRYELQESMSMGVDLVQKAKGFQVGMVVNWLNRILGVGPDSEGLWRQIIKQAQTSFRATISRDKINVGYFLQALQHHGGFKLKPEVRKTSNFRANSNFQANDFLEFTLESAVFDPNFTDHFSTLKARLDVLSYENYQYLAAMLNIHKHSSLSPYYFFNNTGNQLMTYLSNWLSPEEAPFLYPPLLNSPPTNTLYQLKLTAVKWALKAGRLSQAEQVRDQLIEHVNLWIGVSHPVLIELHDLLARYFMASENKPGPALGQFRSVLLNQERLLGAEHFKLADSHFALGEAQFHYSRLSEALLSFKKALSIIQNNNQTQSEAYLQASLKTGEVLLLANAVEESIRHTQRALSLAQQLNINSKYLQAAQLLARSFEVAEQWSDYSRLQQQLITVLSLYSNNLPEFQIILKLVFFLPLHLASQRHTQTSQKLLDFMAMMPNLTDMAVQQKEAYLYLKGKIDQRTFPWLLLEGLEGCQMMVREIELNGLVRRWKGFETEGRQPKGIQFLNQFFALRLLIGSNFIQGLLNNT